MSLNWVEISDRPEELRFRALSEALTEAGTPNQLEFISWPSSDQNADADLAAAIVEAENKFGQIRVGGSLRARVPKVVENFPSSLLWVKAADALVPDESEHKKVWWPRNYLEQGFQRSFVVGIQNVDLSGAVFILGATIEARAAISALSRLGFDRFSIADQDDESCQVFVQEISRAFLGVRVQAIQRSQITQLPAIHSVAINTLVVGQDQGMHNELAYFNFLKPNGIWMDFSLYELSQELEAEARAVGALNESGVQVLAWTDALWAAEVLSCKLSGPELVERYRKVFATSS